jgi:formamidopyrimidine-DNA glycosylase
MPELPEVETIRRDLDGALAGRRAVSAALTDARLLTVEAFAQFKKDLLGKRWLRFGRHGKYLWAHLEDGSRIVFHLRMTGQLVIEKPDEAKRPRLALLFDNDRQLSFYDQRRFGEVWMLRADQSWHSATLPGPDALNELELSDFKKILKNRTTRIHALLLDQRRLAGVGNIYSQEALFKALIRPTRPAKRITVQESERLFSSLRQTLLDAIERRGSTSRNYRDAYGQSGSAQTVHAVYGKGGKPCDRCGEKLRSVRVGGRGTVYCSRCQR